jgi:biotin carboxyl carrier protein
MTITRDALARLLAGSPFSELELTGPDVHLHLRNSASGVTDVTAPADMIAAPALGRVLWRHPLHEAPLAGPGTAVQAGQKVALLQVGTLLRPVLAPAAGIVGAPMQPEGTLVGFGTALMPFHPETP